MGLNHDHEHEHEDHMPKLPKRLGQAFFALIIGIFLVVSIFIYQRLLPINDYVSAQAALSDLTRQCQEDVEALDSTGEWKNVVCPCVSKNIAEDKGKTLREWMKETTSEERLAKYKSLQASCEG
ncbi:MAG: hypothetical protein AAFY71_27745 [Bacteroidota bacterium]